MAGGPFQPGVILRDDAVDQDGHIARIEHLAILVNWTPENDIVNLELTRGPNGVGHGRVNAIHRSGMTIGVSNIVV